MNPHLSSKVDHRRDRGTCLATARALSSLPAAREEELPSGCSLTVSSEDLHHSVLPRQLLFLDPLLFDLFLFRQIGFLSKFFQPVLQFDVFLIMPTQLGVGVDQRTDQCFFFDFHSTP